MTIGFDSPMPPARTGVADYAAALAAALARHGGVQLRPRRADVWLYHLGNNQLHREIYRRAIERPGVVVLHDAVLQHFFLGSLTEPEYIEEFVYNYGEWGRDVARELWRGRAGSALDQRYYAWPMLRRIAERSCAVVVHNPAAARMVHEHAPRTQVIEIPHLFTAPALPSMAEVERFRAKASLDAAAFVFGVFGYLRESKRLPQVLEAFSEVRRRHPSSSLLVAGRFASSDLERAAAPLLSSPGVRRLGYLSVRDFWLAASATDVCINLRYPAAGETSGIAVRMMGLGKTVMLTTSEETSRFPDAACIRVDPGIAETAGLTEYSKLLLSSPQVSLEIGRRAAGHIRLHHAMDRVADQYWQTLCAFAS